MKYLMSVVYHNEEDITSLVEEYNSDIELKKDNLSFKVIAEYLTAKDIFTGFIMDILLVETKNDTMTVAVHWNATDLDELFANSTEDWLKSIDKDFDVKDDLDQEIDDLEDEEDVEPTIH